jgi:hypothetical protein
MIVRNATASDLNAIANILAKAFWDEDATGRFMHPHRESYPQDFEEWWRRRVRVHWWDYRFQILVSTTDKGEVTGVAEWVAHGTSAEKRDLWKLDPRKFIPCGWLFYAELTSCCWDAGIFIYSYSSKC